MPLVIGALLIPSKVVSYSARLVEKLSDVVEGMNLSYCSSIKKGTVEVSGSTTTVNENSFKSSDLNAVISVKVTNQTIMTDGDANFQPMTDMQAGSAAFNQTYGDSYISGFVTGGEFTGIVSIKVIDRSKVNSTVNSIKSALAKSSETTEVTFSPSDSMASNSLSSVMSGIESTISVAWMGGGQVKDGEYKFRQLDSHIVNILPANTPWDLPSVLAAAAAFPANVADCPQRTWAILTKYKANRSFVEWSSASMAKTLEYDQINSYTAELFDHYMDYKLLLKHLQTIIDDRDSFQMRTGVKDALDVSLETLLSVKTVLRQEQSKIVQAVGVLSKDPTALQRQPPAINISKSTAVLNILAAQGLGEQSGQIQVASSASTMSIDEEAVLVEKQGSPAAPAFNFASMIAPEIWENVMPVARPSAQPQVPGTSAVNPGSVLTGFKLPPPPGDDYQYPSVSERKAVAGMEQDLDNLRKQLQDAKQAATDAISRAQVAERALSTANSDFQSTEKEAEQRNKVLNDQLADAKKEAELARGEQGTTSVKLEETARQLTTTSNDLNELKKAFNQKDKDLQDRTRQNTDLMNQRLSTEQANTTEPVNLLAVTYEDCFWRIGDPAFGTRARLMQKAQTREVFQINNQFMCEGRDPAPGKRKFATIVYRRGNTGPVKFIHGAEGANVQFE